MPSPSWSSHRRHVARQGTWTRANSSSLLQEYESRWSALGIKHRGGRCHLLVISGSVMVVWFAAARLVIHFAVGFLNGVTWNSYIFLLSTGISFLVLVIAYGMGQVMESDNVFFYLVAFLVCAEAWLIPYGVWMQERGCYEALILHCFSLFLLSGYTLFWLHLVALLTVVNIIVAHVAIYDSSKWFLHFLNEAAAESTTTLKSLQPMSLHTRVISTAPPLRGEDKYVESSLSNRMRLLTLGLIGSSAKVAAIKENESLLVRPLQMANLDICPNEAATVSFICQETPPLDDQLFLSASRSFGRAPFLPCWALQCCADETCLLVTPDNYYIHDAPASNDSFSDALPFSLLPSTTSATQTYPPLQTANSSTFLFSSAKRDHPNLLLSSTLSMTPLHAERSLTISETPPQRSLKAPADREHRRLRRESPVKQPTIDVNGTEFTELMTLSEYERLIFSSWIDSLGLICFLAYGLLVYHTVFLNAYLILQARRSFHHFLGDFPSLARMENVVLKFATKEMFCLHHSSSSPSTLKKAPCLVSPQNGNFPEQTPLRPSIFRAVYDGTTYESLQGSPGTSPCTCSAKSRSPLRGHTTLTTPKDARNDNPFAALILASIANAMTPMEAAVESRDDETPSPGGRLSAAVTNFLSGVKKQSLNESPSSKDASTYSSGGLSRRSRHKERTRVVLNSRTNREDRRFSSRFRRGSLCSLPKSSQSVLFKSSFDRAPTAGKNRSIRRLVSEQMRLLRKKLRSTRHPDLPATGGLPRARSGPRSQGGSRSRARTDETYGGDDAKMSSRRTYKISHTSQTAKAYSTEASSTADTRFFEDDFGSSTETDDLEYMGSHLWSEDLKDRDRFAQWIWTTLPARAVRRAASSIADIFQYIYKRLSNHAQSREGTIFPASQKVKQMMPRQRLLQQFADDTFEKWYSEWLQTFTPIALRFLKEPLLIAAGVQLIHVICEVGRLIGRAQTALRLRNARWLPVDEPDVAALLERGRVYTPTSGLSHWDPRDLALSLSMIMVGRIVLHAGLNVLLIQSIKHEIVAPTRNGLHIKQLQLVTMGFLFAEFDVVLCAFIMGPFASTGTRNYTTTIYGALAVTPIYASTLRLPATFGIICFSLSIHAIILSLHAPNALMLLFLVVFYGILAILCLIIVAGAGDTCRRRMFTQYVLPYLIYLEGLSGWVNHVENTHSEFDLSAMVHQVDSDSPRLNMTSKIARDQISSKRTIQEETGTRNHIWRQDSSEADTNARSLSEECSLNSYFSDTKLKHPPKNNFLLTTNMLHSNVRLLEEALPFIPTGGMRKRRSTEPNLICCASPPAEETASVADEPSLLQDASEAASVESSEEAVAWLDIPLFDRRVDATITEVPQSPEIGRISVDLRGFDTT